MTNDHILLLLVVITCISVGGWVIEFAMCREYKKALNKEREYSSDLAFKLFHCQRALLAVAADPKAPVRAVGKAIEALEIEA